MFRTQNTEKYITFTVPIEKEVTRIDEMEKLQKNISYILQFIDSARFMARSLWIFLKEFIKLSVDTDMTKKECETCRIKYKYSECFVEYFKDDLIECKCFSFNKNCHHKFGEKLKERFFNTCIFSNNDNTFILFFGKGVYLYEHTDDWERSNETSLPEKEDSHSHLNMEDITDAAHARVWKDFDVKNWGEYNLYVQSDNGTKRY